MRLAKNVGLDLGLRKATTTNETVRVHPASPLIVAVSGTGSNPAAGYVINMPRGRDGDMTRPRDTMVHGEDEKLSELQH